MFDGNDRKIAELFWEGVRLEAGLSLPPSSYRRENPIAGVPNRDDLMRAATSAYMAGKIDSIEYVNRMDEI